MFRGAIENVTDNAVSGWVYSDKLRVTGQTLLAFANNVCVGSGKVGLHRQDLEEAGLGDGKLGFNFGITLNGISAPVVVKFEGSDAMLIPPDSALVWTKREADKLSPDAVQRNLKIISWMAERGWASAEQFISLREIISHGHTTVSMSSLQKSSDGSNGDVLSKVSELFAMSQMAPVNVETLELGTDVMSMLETIRNDRNTCKIVALSVTKKTQIRIHEASHIENAESGNMSSALIVRIQPGDILFFDIRCQLSGFDQAIKGTQMFVGRLP
jgi:hypothetical protein